MAKEKVANNPLDSAPADVTAPLGGPVVTEVAASAGDVTFTAAPLVVPNPVPTNTVAATAPEPLIVRAGRNTEVSTAVDEDREAAVGQQIKDELAAMLSEAAETGKAAAERAATYYAPLMARQAMLERSADPEKRARAARHKRHLFGQALADLAEHGLRYQQRQETRILSAFSRAVELAGKLV